MKIKTILSALILLTFFSCTDIDLVEGQKIELDVAKQPLIPYQLGQKINFIHTNGYAFDFTVVEDTTDWKNNRDKYVFDRTETYYYESFQVRTVKLVAEYPNISITISTSAEPRKDNRLDVNLNDFSTYIPFDKNYKLFTETNFHESIVINNKTYNNVIEAKLSTSYYPIVETNKSILYNEQGLLQIKISDDETFSINN